jgi:hypothetical protein
MSSPDAIPSRGDAVVVPLDLREISKRKLRDAPNLTFAPDRLGGQPPTTNDLDAMGARR